MGQLFDAKYNKLLDSTGLRIAMIVAGFGVWFAAGIGLLKLAL